MLDSRHREALRIHLPALSAADLRPLPHHGWGGDCDVFIADGSTILRFPRSPDSARALLVEARLLPEIAERVPIAVPRYSHLAVDPEGGLPAVGAYPIVPGTPLRGQDLRAIESADPAALAGIAADLAGFLLGLHSLPVERALAAGVTIPSFSMREGVERQRVRIRAELLPSLATDEATALERLLEAYLDDRSLLAWDRVVCHGDLSSDHILADESKQPRLTGVIDFGDLCVGDPAGELTWRAEFGEGLFWQVLERYRPTSDLAAFARAVDFRWRLVPTVEIAYGLETGKAEYVAEGRHELRERLGIA